MSVEDQQIADDLTDDNLFESQEKKPAAKVIDQEQAHKEANIFADAIKAIKESRAKAIPSTLRDKLIELVTHRKEKKAYDDETTTLYETQGELWQSQREYYSKQKWEKVPNSNIHSTTTKQGDRIMFELNKSGYLSWACIKPREPISVQEAEKSQKDATPVRIAGLFNPGEKIEEIVLFIEQEKAWNQGPIGSRVIFKGNDDSYSTSEFNPKDRNIGKNISATLGSLGITPYVLNATKDIRPKTYENGLAYEEFIDPEDFKDPRDLGELDRKPDL